MPACRSTALIRRLIRPTAASTNSSQNNLVSRASRPSSLEPHPTSHWNWGSGRFGELSTSRFLANWHDVRRLALATLQVAVDWRRRAARKSRGDGVRQRRLVPSRRSRQRLRLSRHRRGQFPCLPRSGSPRHRRSSSPAIMPPSVLPWTNWRRSMAANFADLEVWASTQNVTQFASFRHLRCVS